MSANANYCQTLGYSPLVRRTVTETLDEAGHVVRREIVEEYGPSIQPTYPTYPLPVYPLPVEPWKITWTDTTTGS